PAPWWTTRSRGSRRSWRVDARPGLDEDFDPRPAFPVPMTQSHCLGNQRPCGSPGHASPSSARSVVAASLARFRARPALGFSDCLVLETARRAGHLPLGTFDRALARVDGAKLVR
ncbi:MAG: hypothetical protein ACKOUS_06405, partial [Alphaproteobacteria bacterium]